MKNKKVSKIIVLLVVVSLAIGLWALAYSAFKKNDRRIMNKAIFDIVRKYVESDSDFALQYGKIKAMQLQKEVTAIGRYEVHVPCIITVETGKSYLAWIDFDFSDSEKKGTFTYLSVEEIDDSN